jgi:hypothetical protein
VENRGRRLLLANGETLHLIRGETLKLEGVLPAMPPSSGVVVNFKGFVGNRKNNTGEDRGFEIDTGTALMERYSLRNKGERYQVIASRGEEILGRLFLRLSEPRLDYLVLRLNEDKRLLLKPEDRIRLSPEDRICLEAVGTNFPGEPDLRLSVNGNQVKPNAPRRWKDLCSLPCRDPQPAEIMAGGLRLGTIYITMQ